MQGRHLFVTAIALISLAPAASADCIAELSGLLDALAARHQDRKIRDAAEAAKDSVVRACGDAPTTLDASGRVTSGLGDPAVRVMDTAHFERTLVEWMGEPVAGIGLAELLSIDIDEQTGFLTVIAPVPGSPAAKGGVRAGDVVVTIDGAATGSLGLTRSMQRLRIAAGERIDLGVLRGDRLRTLTLEAVESAPLEAVTAEHRQLAGRRVLHVHLRQFVPGAAEKLRAAVEAADVDAVLLDLRDNPGGLVDELQRSAGLFLAPGESIARIAGPEPALLSVADDAEPVDTPLHVIINAGTASAAEALAGALQAHGRARLYGERSFGKGLVHQPLPMAGGLVAMFPTGQLETPAGRPILGGGIVPDVRTSNPVTVIGLHLGE